MPPKSAEKKDPRAWDALTPPLAEWLLDAISSLGWSKMTPVQASTIPLFLKNSDVVVEAVTGSGKTLAFVLPIIQKLLRLEEPLKKHHVGAIIISPTRELATQIHSVVSSLLAFHGPSAAALKLRDGESEEFPSSALKVIPQLLLGGTTKPAQDLSHFLKGNPSPNLLIGTPGRLLELLSSPHVHCTQSSFEVLVLDEADRLLDMGFKDDLSKILARLPKQRRTGLFSASVSEAVGELIRVGLRNPVKISVKVKNAAGKDSRVPASLQMSYILTKPDQKLPATFSLLSQGEYQKVIIYLSTCAAVDYWGPILQALLPKPYSLFTLHGKLPINVRQKNFAKFVSSVSNSVLLTTDVAARGLDIPQVDLVIQIDPPSDPKVFLHRCGRAGRAGRKGLAVLCIQPGREEDYIPFLAVRQTGVFPLKTPVISIDETAANQFTKRIRREVLKDRGLHDKAQRAFVSWVKSYSKHEASSIFRVDDLDWAALGHAWGLLNLPKMPELKTWSGDKSLGLKGTVDMATYAYADKVREKTRLKEMEEKENAGPWVPTEEFLKRKREREAWSEKYEKKDVREEKRERKRRKREAERVKGLTEEEKKKEEELAALIEEVKSNKLNVDDANVFQGFSD